jgi:UDP-glucose 4-epimerase
MNKKVLVTGANGFIGQHLCRYLIDNGYQVRGLYHENRPLYFVSKQEIEWVNADLSDQSSIQGVTDSIEVIIHLAAIPRNDLRKTWEDFLAINVNGTRYLLSEAQKSGIKKFIFISTVEAAGYGDGIHPRTEDDPPKPDNNYGKSKLEAEKLVLSEQWTFKKTVLRLPMIYGPGTLLVVPKLFGMVRKGFYPFIGSGKTLMEFCYVGNVAKAIALTIESGKTDNKLFYISDHRSYTIKEVIDAIAHAMGKKYLPLHIPQPVANMTAVAFEILARIYPYPPVVSPYSKKPFFTRETVRWTTRNINFISTEKFQKTTGFIPPYSIDQGCAETVKWLEKNYFNKENR